MITITLVITHLYANDFNTFASRIRTLIIIDFDEARRCENENQGSILRREEDEFLRDVRNPPGGGLYAHRGESTFNKRALHRDDGGARIYRVRYSRCTVRGPDTFCNQTLLHRSIYTTNRKSRSFPPFAPPSSIGPRYVQGVSLPACLPTWMTRYLRKEEGGRGSQGDSKGETAGPMWSGLYRKDAIRGDLILVPVYMNTRRGYLGWGQK